jgi:predicted PhzF superfamily epimerase YddE/YHI9
LLIWDGALLRVIHLIESKTTETTSLKIAAGRLVLSKCKILDAHQNIGMLRLAIEMEPAEELKTATPIFDLGREYTVNEHGLRLIYTTIETRETAEARTISPGGYELGTFTRAFQ